MLDIRPYVIIHSKSSPFIRLIKKHKPRMLGSRGSAFSLETGELIEASVMSLNDLLSITLTEQNIKMLRQRRYKNNTKSQWTAYKIKNDNQIVRLFFFLLYELKLIVDNII